MNDIGIKQLFQWKQLILPAIDQTLGRYDLPRGSLELLLHMSERALVFKVADDYVLCLTEHEALSCVIPKPRAEKRPIWFMPSGGWVVPSEYAEVLKKVEARLDYARHLAERGPALELSTAA